MNASSSGAGGPAAVPTPAVAASSNAKQTPGLLRNQSLKRAVGILRALADRPEATTSEVAVAVGLPRPTTARLLATLADSGLAERLRPGDGWVLGYEATRLGRAGDPYGLLIRRAQLHLEQLTASTGESSVLAVTRFPLDVEIISQIDSPYLLSVANWVGRKFGLHASVSGKLAYARLSEELRDSFLDGQSFERYTDKTITTVEAFRVDLRAVRQQGYACSIDELEIGLTMIGVDVPARGDLAAVASVGIMGPTSRILHARNDALAAVKRCSQQLSELVW
jgi:DNA-binding IclR family transcriptional regulator